MRQIFKKRTALSLATLAVLASATAHAQQGDPLYRYQWHLMNYGQQVLGDTRPVSGIDLGIDDLHDYNIRGKGVIVGVLDEGTEIRHPDLAANVVPNGSWNFNDGSHDPTPTNPDAAHGTSVSGIIAAVGWNGIGVRGVAPGARLKSFNFLDSDANNEQIQYAWWDGPESKDVAVSNNSWGSTIPLFLTVVSENELAAWENPMSATRGGLGTVYVKAAGNSFASVPHPLFGELCPASAAQVGCSQSINDTEANYFNVITVAAANAAGKRSSYSTPGASVWVSGLGGEYGWERASVSVNAPAGFADRQPAVRFDPAIVTTDLSGCVNGYNANAVVPPEFVSDLNLNRLESDQSAIDSTCNYGGTMNGTSAAAPTVSGVVALMLQANPKLSFRDVKYILATTSRRIDPNQAAVTNADGTVLSAGWTVNAAGRAFSNWYGYGLVDATMAVTRATGFKSLGRLVDSGWQPAQVAAAQPIGNVAAPARATVRIAGGAGRVEAVQIGMASDYPLDFLESTTLRVSLISPSGTRAIVVPAGAAFAVDTMTFDLAAVNAFIDETGNGDWTLEVVDTALAAGAETKGNLTSFKIRVLGH
ncbi:peptidase, families S8 and S53/proprotein convertase P-domain protein [Lysobacter enzymogenes]|uniref:Peptidase, families S8 and S53/proprotein convertase P-domain protein n=1 Tax=Lysobacter enzymogenes TaxID=69 RepID=A0A0S2DB85_LYSEN|nr:S8 family serine peptidase [Lysobacter enzymogenes]ALN55779.1 peptidase, families S8 and S53/proprotein convertase P-domain protein [Lysobacter enzymogenes]QCW24773.1 serine protease [Lysobacter enzymogenes]